MKSYFVGFTQSPFAAITSHIASANVFVHAAGPVHCVHDFQQFLNIHTGFLVHSLLLAQVPQSFDLSTQTGSLVHPRQALEQKAIMYPGFFSHAPVSAHHSHDSPLFSHLTTSEHLKHDFLQLPNIQLGFFEHSVSLYQPSQAVLLAYLFSHVVASTHSRQDFLQ
jgi:hypothetical protein